VPYVRGRERSREPSVVIEEARQMIASGYKDITLLGQNVNSYGKGLDPRPTFAGLIGEIDKIPGDYWLRFMTSHPKDCTRELIDTIAQSEHISLHLHLPFQSGSDRILKAMNRRYTREKYLDIVNYAKEKIPHVSLTSDVIVGFPGETYEDFQETLSLIREVGFTSLFTFIYSPRKGTPAAEMDNPVSDEEKGRWFRELLAVQEEIAASRCAETVGTVEKVLVEEKAKTDGRLVGRTSGNIIVEFDGADELIGTFKNVKITAAGNWILHGELLP
jgi:tRNA-2-methylthio-N6-dimethylallyladenosine synthase